MQPTYLMFLPSQRLCAVNARLHAIAIDNWPIHQVPIGAATW